MQGVPEKFEHPKDVAHFRRPAHRDGIELYRAHIVRHAFEPHTHEAYGVGAIESGVEGSAMVAASIWHRRIRW